MPLNPPAYRSPDGAARRCVLLRWGGELVVGVLPLLIVAAATWRLFALPASYVAQVVGLYCVMSGVMLLNSPRRPASPGLGAANRITLGRSILVLPIATLALHPDVPRDAGYWWIILWSTTAMLMDSLDGRVARRSGTTSVFGARFDMELDAFLMLALSLLVWQSGKVGPWVLLIGALRYLFVAGGWVWPDLRSDLPESQRRKTICVAQGVVLLVCLGPIVRPGIASIAAAGGLALLAYSFGVDIGWLLEHGRKGTEGENSVRPV